MTALSSLPAKPLVVVLGLGEMGTVHAQNLARQRGIRLGLASSRKQDLSALAAVLHADAQYNSYDAVFADPDVCAVVIATAPHTHPELITAAAQAGKHIFSEKPLGMDRVSILTAMTAVQGAGVRFMTGFMRRWDPGYVAARDRLRAGKVGRVVVLKCSSGDAAYPIVYQREPANNAMFRDLSVHDIDLAHWLTGSRVRRVFVTAGAMTYPELEARDDCDVAVLVMDMECGAKIMVHLSRALDYGYCVETEIVGTKGSLRVGELGGVQLREVCDAADATTVDKDYRVRFAQAFDGEMAAFAKLVLAEGEGKVAALLNGNDSYAGLKAGLDATCVAEALIQSKETGQAVEVEYV